MFITCVYHMHITCTSHAHHTCVYHMHITCTTVYHIHTTCTLHAHHMHITCTSHVHHIHVLSSLLYLPFVQPSDTAGPFILLSTVCGAAVKLLDSLTDGELVDLFVSTLRTLFPDLVSHFPHCMCIGIFTVKYSNGVVL